MRQNFLFAVIFSVIFIFFSNFFTPKPANHIEKSESIEIVDDSKIDPKYLLPIKTKTLVGELNLKGLKINKIKLLNYKETIDGTENVEILTDKNDENSYFINFGFAGSGIELPNRNTIWKIKTDSNNNELSENNPIVLTWTNENNLTFEVTLTAIDDYLINADLTVSNPTKNTYDISSYILLNRSYDENKLALSQISHEGLTGSIEGKLEEYSYSSIKSDKEKIISDTSIDWFGMSDKYWMAAIIPSRDKLHKVDIQYDFVRQKDKIQASVMTKRIKLEPEDKIKTNFNLFLGPKDFHILEKYREQFNIKLFDRVIDFGWLYPITKPIFLALVFINKYVGNFGFSILILTLLIKILVFGITNKAYKSMQAIKNIQPEIENLKQKYANDKLQLNKSILDLYKLHKVNPFIGLLSIIIQIPIFFGIYKVLYVTIEMRHAPFVWWIKDLSAPDPTNIFDLFGLISYDLPSFLHLGALPILMSFTMYIQQTFTPVQDPIQAKIMRFLPLIFLFTFNNFPAGLLIYWTFSNLFGIVQQMLLKRN